jgi:hypothetical protein
MSKQQNAFETMWNHFVVNKGPLSVLNSTKSSVCVYRGPFGAKCAIGLLIPDALFRAEFEGKVMMYLPDDIKGYLYQETGFTLTQLTQLQECHDDASRGPEFHPEIEQALRTFAVEHGLTVPA